MEGVRKASRGAAPDGCPWNSSDEQGHLFVCDYNNRCVHLLSATDGVHLGVVVRKGEKGLGKPKEVAWHEESESLIVAHYKDTGFFTLSVFSRHD